MSIVQRLALVSVVLALPAAAYAQEAVINGTISDATGGVLPGVTVTATHTATGTTFVAVTDGQGAFRLPVRVGAFDLTAALSGFATVMRGGIELLIGQTATVDLELSVSQLEETVTVSGEAPLLNVTTSSLGGNVDPQQVQELPVQGRNWMSLAMLAPGSRMNSPNANVPQVARNTGEQPEFQFSIDGQQVTSELGYGGQPRYSQDSIAEFQFISNRFDATQGRSTGVQVRAITKSGTNVYSGSIRGNFRDSSLNAADPIFDRVVPVSNQQLAFTAGGPITTDRAHFFSFFEYEREPRTSIWNTPYPEFNVELQGNTSVKLGGGRIDFQVSPNTRLMGKAQESRRWVPFGAGNQNHPAATGSSDETNREYLGSLTTVIGNRVVNEVRVGYSRWIFKNRNLTNWPDHWQSFRDVTNGSPRITFNGFSIGGNPFYPRHGAQDQYSFREDFTVSYEARGRHDLRLGADFLRTIDDGDNCQRCMGNIDARGGSIDSLGMSLPEIFPDWQDAGTWNLAAISPIVRRYTIGIGDFTTHDIRPRFGAWAQDDWQVSETLTLNLGIRWDLSKNAQANNYAVEPFISAGRPDDTNNVQPRLGFAYQLDPSTVIRGGTGMYFAEPLSIDTYWMAANSRLVVIEINNDGRPDFAADPFNGQSLPTKAEAEERFCYVNNAPGCLVRSIRELVGQPEYTTDLARAWQNSFGFQRQIGDTVSFEADYVYTQGRFEKDIIDNTNLTFNPETGVNYPFSDVSRRAFPLYGVISQSLRTGKSSYHGLQTAFRKRMSNRWQASGTYTLSGLWDSHARPVSGLSEVPFDTAPDLGGEFTLSQYDQRHRMVFNGIWQVARGFQVSGLVFVGVGERSDTRYGGDVRDFGANGSGRLRPDGTIVPRNSFVQPARKRVDVRFQQRVPLGERVSVDAIAEFFNVFNTPNYVVQRQEVRRDFGQNVNGENRTAQLGFRLTF